MADAGIEPERELKLRICNDMISSKSYGYTIPNIIEVTLNNNSKIKVAFEHSINAGLENPTIIKSLIQELNTMMIPGKIIKSYTYAIIDIEDILFFDYFHNSYKTIEREIINEMGTKQIIKGIDKTSDLGISILTDIIEELKEYIIRGSDGKIYLMFSKKVDSNMEVFNKHGSMVLLLKNTILERYCDYLDVSNMDHLDVLGSIFNLYFLFGTAGEFILKKKSGNQFDLKFNFLSGTLMKSDYDNEKRLRKTTISFIELIKKLNQFYKINLIKSEEDLIPTNIDKTNEVIKLIDRGVKFYNIYDKEKLFDILKNNKTAVYWGQLRMNISMLLMFLDKELYKEEIARLKILLSKIDSSYSLTEQKEVKEFIDILNTIVISNNERPIIIQTIVNINNINNNIYTYLSTIQEIKMLFKPENLIESSMLKRRTGGAKKPQKSKKSRITRKSKKSKKSRITRKNNNNNNKNKNKNTRAKKRR